MFYSHLFYFHLFLFYIAEDNLFTMLILLMTKLRTTRVQAFLYLQIHLVVASVTGISKTHLRCHRLDMEMSVAMKTPRRTLTLQRVIYFALLSNVPEEWNI